MAVSRRAVGTVLQENLCKRRSVRRLRLTVEPSPPREVGLSVKRLLAGAALFRNGGKIMQNTTLEKIQELQQANRWQEMIDYLKPIVEFGDKRVEHWRALGFAYSQLNRYDEARYCYKQWLELEPNRAQPYYSLGYTYYHAGQWKEAIEWFDKALEVFPDYLVCLYRKGVAQYSMLKSQKAKETLKKAVLIYQGYRNDGPLKRNAKYYYKAIFYLGKAYYEMGQYYNALACFLKLEEEDKRHYLAPHFKKYNLSKGYAGVKKYPEAEKIIAKLCKHPQAKDYMFDLYAQIQAARQNYEAAFENFKKALQKRPAAYILCHRAELYMELGRLNEAEADLHEALRRDKIGKHKILLALGKIALQQNKLPEAKSYFLRAIEFKKKIYAADFYEGHLALGEYYHLNGEEEMAKDEYAVAAELQSQWQ